MRANELIGRDVVDSAGARVGVVTDLRCVQDGPLRGAMCLPRVHALVISRHHVGSMLGYNRRPEQGPWLVRRMVRALHRGLTVVPWSQVASWEGGRVVLKTASPSGHADR
jgi:PRC-barrel domain